MDYELQTAPQHSATRLERQKAINFEFDPVIEWQRIRDSVSAEVAAAGENPTNFDQRIRREHAHFDGLAKKLVSSGAIESWAHLHTLLRGAERAIWAMKSTQELNVKLYPGFDISEVFDVRVLTQLIAFGEFFHSAMATSRNLGKLDKRWVPIDTVDAMCASSGLSALATREGLPMGRRVVELGAGDGTWGFVLAQLGFEVTLIERDKILVDHFHTLERRLDETGIKRGSIHMINGQFSHIDSQNSSEIKQSLQEADIMTCYPWPHEVEDRLKLFEKYGKPNSLLLLYGGTMDDLLLDVRALSKYHLEVIGTETNAMLKSKARDHKYVRGYDTPSFGANWIVLRKQTTPLEPTRINSPLKDSSRGAGN